MDIIIGRVTVVFAVRTKVGIPEHADVLFFRGGPYRIKKALLMRGSLNTPGRTLERVREAMSQRKPGGA